MELLSQEGWGEPDGPGQGQSSPLLSPGSTPPRDPRPGCHFSPMHHHNAFIQMLKVEKVTGEKSGGADRQMPNVQTEPKPGRV